MYSISKESPRIREQRISPRATISYKLVSVQEIMQRFHVELFVHLSRTLTGLDLPLYSAEAQISEEEKSNYREIFKDFGPDCIACGLPASNATILKITGLLDDPGPTYRKLRELAKELFERIVDEMHATLFLSLTLQEVEYYNNPRRGWESIIARFPDVVSDVEEAWKCFALNRYAAAIFHSLQIVETKFIEVADPHSGWTAVANELSRIVKKNYTDRTSFEKQHFQFLEQLQGTVEALKNAWRNKISHAQGKLTLLTPHFTPDIAEEILFASRAFMRRLADGIPLKEKH